MWEVVVGSLFSHKESYTGRWEKTFGWTCFSRLLKVLAEGAYPNNIRSPSAGDASAAVSLRQEDQAEPLWSLWIGPKWLMSVHIQVNILNLHLHLYDRKHADVTAFDQVWEISVTYCVSIDGIKSNAEVGRENRYGLWTLLSSANSEFTITTDYKNPSVVCCVSEFVTSA